MDRIEIRVVVRQALDMHGLEVPWNDVTGYYLPKDTLLTGDQVSAAVKADPDNLAAEAAVCLGMSEFWDGKMWRYALTGDRSTPNADTCSDDLKWRLVYRAPAKAQPQVFHSLAEYVAWGEHPDRLNKVSGVDDQGYEVAVCSLTLDSTRILEVDGCRSWATLPITAVDPDA